MEEDLTKKVIGQLKAYGFEYMKMDYNDTIGIGCDGAESLGESLRQNMEASMNFIDKVKEGLLNDGHLMFFHQKSKKNHV